MKNLFLFCILILLASCQGKNKKSSVKKPEEKLVVKDSSLQAIMDKMTGEMQAVNLSGNNDRDFATYMVEYTKGAIQMANFESVRGKNLELVKFAKDVIENQEEEIKRLNSFLKNEPGDKSPSSKEFQRLLNGCVKVMVRHEPSENNTDRLFALLMIVHHESAVQMAKTESTYGSHQTLKIAARSMIAKQGEEIEWLNSWLQKN